MEQVLKLNLATMRYRGAYTIEFDIEAEIVFRAVVRYAEENNLDATSLADWEKAIQAVARSSKWVDHARAKWLEYPHMKPAPGLTDLAPVVQPAPAERARVSPLALPANRARRGRKPGPAKRVKYHVMSLEEVEAFRARALATPVDQWETLKTPLMTGVKYGAPLTKERRDNYYRRSDENAVLKALKAEMEPAKLDTLEAVAGALNGLRNK